MMSRRRSSPGRITFRPQCQELDPRIAPAGNVTAALDAPTGKLTILGVNDLTSAGILAGNNDNQLSIVGTAPGAFKLDGLTGTLVNGAASTSFTGVKSVHIDLREGHDTVIFKSATLSGALTFIGGNGFDTLAFDGSSGPNQLGSVNFQGNAGNDSLVAQNGKLTILGLLSAQTHTGADEIRLGLAPGDEVEVGQLQVVNSHGKLSFEVRGNSFTSKKSVSITNGNEDASVLFQSANITLGDTLTMTSAHGSDTFTLGAGAGKVSGRGVSLNLGYGYHQIQFIGASHQHVGKITVNAGVGQDFINFDAIDVAGHVLLNTGQGQTSVYFKGTNNQISGDLKLTSGWGDDLIEAKGADLTIGGGAYLNFGPGKSRVDLANANSLTISGPLSITSSTENDTVRLGETTGNVTLGPVTIQGGAGSNNVVIRGKTNTVNGGIKITNLDGFDLVQMSGITINGNLSIQNGNGGSEVFFILGKSKITGDVTLTNGAGDDSLNIVNDEFVVGGKMLVQFGTELAIVEGNATNQINVGKSLTLTGSGLNNRIQFSSKLTVGEDLRLDNGGGETKFLNAVTVGRKLSYFGKLGFDSLRFSGPSLTVNDTASWNFGKGGSYLLLGSLNQVFNSGVTILGDEGVNSVFFGSGSAVTMKRLEFKTVNDSELRFIPDSATNLTVTGDVGLFGSKGADVAGLVGKQVIGGKLMIDTGGGGDTVRIRTTVVGGTSMIRTGDDADLLDILNAKFQGTVVVDMGAGGDLMTLDDSVFNQTVSIGMGDGDDTVRIEELSTGQRTVFQKAVQFKLGAGTDDLLIASPGVNTDFGEFQAGVSIDGGGELDIGRFLPVGSGGKRFNTFAVFPTLIGLEAVE